MPTTQPDDRPDDDRGEPTAQISEPQESEPQPSDTGVDRRTDAEREAARFGGD